MTRGYCRHLMTREILCIVGISLLHTVRAQDSINFQTEVKDRVLLPHTPPQNELAVSHPVPNSPGTVL